MSRSTRISKFAGNQFQFEISTVAVSLWAIMAISWFNFLSVCEFHFGVV